MATKQVNFYFLNFGLTTLSSSQPKM